VERQKWEFLGRPLVVDVALQNIEVLQLFPDLDIDPVPGGLHENVNSSLPPAVILISSKPMVR
jgi:hypothetical protein